MSAGAPEAYTTPSLLDRLMDPGPERNSSPWAHLRELKASVCRDLTALLNTRRAESDFNPDFEEATNSILTFGVVDFTSFNLKNSIEQQQVRRSIERAIRQFEPRLTGVTVSMEEPDPLRPVLNFQIEAMLAMEPDAEPVLFDVDLRRDSRRVAVSGGDR